MIQPPDYAALINRSAATACALRYLGRRELAEGKLLYTGLDPLEAPISVAILDGTIQIPVHDAVLFVAPFVQVMTPVRADYAGRLLMARLTVTLDGETVVDKELVERFLVTPPCRFASSENSDGDPLVYVGREEDALLGSCRLHFLPNNSRIQMTLENIPAGGSVIRLVGGAVMGHYTTKPKKESGLFEVGILDDYQNATAISRQWPGGSSSHKQLTQDKIEEAHGNALRTALEDKENELRRLREAGEAELRAKVEEKDREIKRLQEDFDLRAKALETKRTLDAGLSKAQELSQWNDAVSRTYSEKSDDKAPMPAADLDEALARARKRLFRWGIVAILAFIAAAAGIIVFKAFMARFFS